MLKLASIAISSLLVYASPAAYAGVGDGAGGGGGQLSLASGYVANAFSVSAFSNKSGALAQVLKYYVLAGAVREENSVMVTYAIAGQDSAMIESNHNPASDSQYYQLNFNLPYADLVELRSGFTPAAQVTMLRFKGALADDLYAGMEKSGLTPVGFNLDANGQVVGNIYSDTWIGCDKRVDVMTCHLEVGNK